MTMFFEFLQEMKKFEFGVTISPFCWLWFFNTDDAHFYLQLGPFAIDIGWGL